MEYTIKALSELAGVSTRTLRYYEEIGLLKPKRINSSNYRIYGEPEVNLLQQILLYRELDLPLDTIKSIITSKEFDPKTALHEHKSQLLKRKAQIELLIHNVEHTICAMEGEIIMSDKEKFEGFKKEKIKENEAKYGEEIRGKYGNKTVDAANQKFASMSEEEYQECDELATEILNKLKVAMETQESSSELAREVVKMHRKWLSFYGDYNDKAHIGLGQMYVADERFTKYYDEKAGDGAAKFLAKAIEAYYC